MISRLVSIIIPCYNAEHYLEQTLQSALAQTYPQCEIIVIDDGSTDRSLEILKRYNAQIRWESGFNRGSCAARNQGLRLAHGEYIQFLDADDLLHPEKVQTHVSILQETEFSAINSPTYCFYKNEEVFFQKNLPQWKDFILDGVEFCIQKRLGEINQYLAVSHFNIHVTHSHPHCWLVKRESLDKIGPWDEALKIAQDTEYFDRLLLHLPKVYFSGKILTGYRMNVPDSISKGQTRKHQESFLRYIQSAETILEYNQSERARIGLARLYFQLILRCIPQHRDLLRICNQRIRELKVPRGQQAHTPLMKKLTRIFGSLPAAWLLYLCKGSSFR